MRVRNHICETEKGVTAVPKSMEDLIATYRPIPEHLLASTYWGSLQRSSALRRAFRSQFAPKRLAEWLALPCTTPADYVDAELVDVYRSEHLNLVPTAPRDLDKPEFPLPVFQRQSELAATSARVHQVLVLTKVPDRGHVTIVCARSGRYHATDLSDAMINLGYRVSIVVATDRGSLDMVSRLAPDAVVWTAALQVPAEFRQNRFVTLSTETGDEPLCPRHTCVLSYDVAPFVAAWVDGSWLPLDDHFFLEDVNGEVPLITSLCDHTLPLLRFRPK